MQDRMEQIERLKANIAQFIIKLYQILQKKQWSEIICWESNNTEVLIKNHKKLQEKVLLNFFRHRHFSSFVRQLNMYGFNKVHKLVKQKNHTYFKNEYFQRFDIQKLTKIKRKNLNKSEIAKQKQFQVQVKQEPKENIQELNYINNIQFINLYPSQVTTIITKIQRQIRKIIKDMQQETIQKNPSKVNQCDYKESQKRQEIKALYTLQRLTTIVQLCGYLRKQTIGFQKTFNLTDQIHEQLDQSNLAFKDCQAKIECESIIVPNKQEDDKEEKDENKNVNMFKSIGQILPKFDSVVYFESQCSLEKQNIEDKINE